MLLKKFVILILTISASLFSAYLKNIPMEISQPDGTIINCYATGDEFFNRLHDENDFTIIQSQDGWYYYGVESEGNVIPGKYKAGTVNPESIGIKKRAVISKELYLERVENFNNYDKSKDAPTSGTIENIVIFIRFADETEEVAFGHPRSYYDDVFNKADGPSLKHYFKEVSYNNLLVNSTYYPETTDFTYNLSYQDTYTRGYFQPYNATTNPVGYEGGDNGSERTEREHALLERAVNAIESEIPAKLAIDGDGDGYVDNVVFLISGMPGAWASLLWPHRWSLYSRTVEINGKRVYDYNFDITGSSTYFHTGVICHEFFHSLGAPDLYHYYDTSAPDAVGSWDIMNDTGNPPQYMGAYMKYKYGDWITDIPVITDYGEYTLNPLTSSENNIYRINSPNSVNEFFILEYRKQDGIYESSLPGSDDGILIYRINSTYNGNAMGPPDEVYIYRPGGTTSVTGSISDAQFSSQLGRTQFNVNTNPFPFLSDESEGGINIYNIGSAGETISFSYGMNVNPPQQFVAGSGKNRIFINWKTPEVQAGYNVDHYNLYKNGVLLTTTTELFYEDTDVVYGETYNYGVSAYYTGTESGESPTVNFTVNHSVPKSLPFTEDFETTTEWTQFNVNCTPRWSRKFTSTAGGTRPEIFAIYEEVDNATARYVSPALSTTGQDTVSISFKHLFDAYSSGLSISLEYSPDMFNWTDTDFYYDVSSSNIGQEEVTLELSGLPDPVYFSWTLEGNLYNFDGWYVDDVYVKGNNSSIANKFHPVTTDLIGNYPNPFNPVTRIDFDLAENSKVNISIYNESGALVETVVNSFVGSGTHSVSWNAKKHSAGIYFISMRTETGFKMLKKMTLLK